MMKQPQIIEGEFEVIGESAPTSHTPILDKVCYGGAGLLVWAGCVWIYPHLYALFTRLYEHVFPGP